MKTKSFIFILCALIFFTSHLYSQTYLDGSNEWYALRGDAFDNWYSISSYEIAGDTIIAGKEYRKISICSDYLQLTYMGTDTIVYQPYSTSQKFLREEDNRFYTWQFGMESLVIDFNLELGDVIEYSYDEEIVEIDSMLIGNEMRKIFLTSHGNKVYEGIGTNKGLFEGLSYLGDEAFGILLCYSDNTGDYDINSGWTPPVLNLAECGEVEHCEEIILNVDLEVQNECLKLFPNPTNGFFTIEGNFENYSIQILASDGTVYQNLTNQSTPIEVDISNLPTGLFFIQVMNNVNNEISLKHIIKQE